MNVLNLVTNPDAQFFTTQVESLRRQGVDGDVVAVPGRRRATEGGADGRSPLDYLQFYPRVLRRSRGDYDIVHANYGLTAPAALAQPTRPVVLTLWGSDLLGPAGPLSRACARLADAVVVMTEGMAAALGPVDAHVVPHGVDLDLFRPIPQAAAREAVGWDEDITQVLFPYAAGRPVKDHPRAVAVVDRAAERLGEDVRLRTLSGVPHARMPLYHNAADALLLTSKREGSPNVVKEALACDRPVVATRVGDVPERLAGVDNAHVCRTDAELVDALVAVLDRGARSNGRRHVASLSVERMAERLRSVYDSVLDPRDGADAVELRATTRAP